MNNIKSIKHLCIGCGMCATVCDRISFKKNGLGFWLPEVDNSCINCGKCVRACPMMMQREEQYKVFTHPFKEESKAMTFETGCYLGCFEGYLDRHRYNSASGGMCSELLIQLLERQMVDSIYCVGPTEGEQLYNYQRVCTKEDILNNAKSAYYPVRIDSVIQNIKKRHEKTAVVCIPCHATAIRMAMLKDCDLSSNIKYIIGLVCGGLPGSDMIEYIALAEGIDFNDISKVTFREKDTGIKCNNCQMKMYNQSGKLLGTSRYHGEAYGFAYLNKLFHNDACFCCDNVFAEAADVVFGDAWFDENKSDEYGTSICLTRKSEIETIIEEISCNNCNVKKSTVNRIILAQKNVGVVQQKKLLSSMYRFLFRKTGYIIPERGKVSIPIKEVIRVSIRCLFRAITNSLWSDYKSGKTSFADTDRKLHIIVKLKKRLRA